MSRALHDLHVLFEDASFIALCPPAAALRGEHRTSLRSSAAFRPVSLNRSSPAPARWLLLLSWGSPKTAPSSTSRSERPLPAACGWMRTSFPSLPMTWGCHLQVRSVLAVPPGFDGFLRSCAAGLFHPAADHGVHCVSASCSLGCLGRRLDCSSLLPPHLSSAFPLSRSVRPERTNLGPPSEGFPSNEAVPGLTLLRLWKRLQAVLPRALFFRSILSLARWALPWFQLPSPPGSSSRRARSPR